MTNLEYFMSSIEAVVKSPKRMIGGLWLREDDFDGTFNIGQFREAVCNQRTLRAMRKFYWGNISWYMGGDNTLEEATQKVKDDIGFVFSELSLWRRFKWWLICGIRWSDRCHA